MNGEEKKTSLTTILLIIGAALVIILIIFTLFTSPSTKISESTLAIKFNGNTTLKSNSYFNLNFTITNPYDIPLDNLRVWVEAGKLFTISSNLLNNATTLRNLPNLPPKANITYFLGNVKVENIKSEMKNVPIIIKALYNAKIQKDLTINVASNNSLKLYGGIENIGIKEISKINKSPLTISFSFTSNNFVFEEGKRSIAPLKIIIENSGKGACVDNINIKIRCNENLSCFYNNKLIGSFEIFVKLSSKVEIPCNYTLSYLKEKDFDSAPLSIQLSCNYLESKSFYFNIIQAK
jgi:hypothetical protein